MSQNNPARPFPGKKPAQAIAPGTLDVKKELEGNAIPVVEVAVPAPPADGIALPDSTPVEKITFLSLHRSPMFFTDPLKPTEYIRFNQSMYSTADPKEIEYLRKSPQLEQEYWEGTYPEWVIQKKKKDKESISLVNEEEPTDSN